VQCSAVQCSAVQLQPRQAAVRRTRLAHASANTYYARLVTQPHASAMYGHGLALGSTKVLYNIQCILYVCIPTESDLYKDLSLSSI
jgi:hypothetical protein